MKQELSRDLSVPENLSDTRNLKLGFNKHKLLVEKQKKKRLQKK